MELSERVHRLEYAATAALKLIAAEQRARGVDVIDLGIGEVKFGFPPKFRDALTWAAAREEDEYTHAAGTIELRRALARAHNSAYYLAVDAGAMEACLYGPLDIVHGISAKFLITLTAMTVADPGDDVMIIDPSWPLYASSLEAVGLRPVRTKTTAAEAFSPSLTTLESAYTPRTKAIIINSPNNPTGRVYTVDELRDVLAFAYEHDLLIISDEVYDSIVFGEHTHVSIASISDWSAQQTVVVKGLSKTYGMGGLRFGYALSKNQRIIEALTKLVSNTITCSPSILQAAVPALLHAKSHVRKIRDTYAERTAALSEAFARLGVDCLIAEGTPFLFPDVSSSYGGRINTSRDVSTKLLEEEGIVSLPGRACGDDGHIRLSLVEETPRLLEAAERIARFLERYRP